MWIPDTKTTLINELYHIWKGTYKRYEISRVYDMEYYKEPRRAKYYAHRAAIKKLQAFLISSREKIKQIDGDIKQLKFNVTIEEIA